MRITSKGQVTIPAIIREKAGLMPHTEVEFVIDDEGARIRKKLATANSGAGSRVLAQLRGHGDVSMSTDDIMALTRKD